MYIIVTVLTVDLAALQVPASVKHDPDPVYIPQLPSRTLLSLSLAYEPNGAGLCVQGICQA
jgi:hypothetical protein